MSWTPAEIPPQHHRRALITGANSGIGYHTALELARHGATVMLASRDRTRGEAALANLRAEVPHADVELVLLDLASLQSIRTFAQQELTHNRPLHLLINNAGVMAPPARLETADGFELQFGTNVLGHFALTGLLLPALERAALASKENVSPVDSPQTAVPVVPTDKATIANIPVFSGDLLPENTTQPPRIVTIASIAHKRGQLNFDDLQSTRTYSPMGAYQQSKLADLVFAFELDRRLRAANSPILSLAAHPGVANTNLFQPGDRPAFERAIRKALGRAIHLLLNTDAEGAIPTLYAATSPQAQPGAYYGPQGFQEMRGADPGPAKIAPQALNQNDATRLWQTCEQLTQTHYLDQRQDARRPLLQL